MSQHDIDAIKDGLKVDQVEHTGADYSRNVNAKYVDLYMQRLHS